jgi:DNA-binding NarL/FixJ family response regulator
MIHPTTNIIIADDHQLVIDGIKGMLKSEEHFAFVGEANNGQEALNIINAKPEHYHMLITDISMPTMGGIELCKIIKEQHAHVKVVIVSMHNNNLNIQEAINAEADGYILKTAGKTEFVGGLNRVIENGTYFSQEIVPLMLQQMQKEKKHAAHGLLSTREKEVLALIVREFTSREIAEKLFISKQTVDTHRINIMAKTESKTLVGLIKYAINAGFV